MSARLNLDPGRGDGGDRMTGVMGMTGLTWMTEKEEEEEKEEKEEEKEEEGKFLRTGRPTKGSTIAVATVIGGISGRGVDVSL